MKTDIREVDEMKFWKSLWLSIKAQFKPSIMSCSNCYYKMDCGCCASCGNNEGKVCGAWFPAT